MKYTSQISRFSSYLNGQTPYVKDGNWWVGDTDTGVAAAAKDGVSFVGIEEYYRATLATRVDSSTGQPDVPPWDNGTGWFRTIEETGFGTKGSKNSTYKYLWNVEIVKSKDSTGTELKTISDPELFLTYTDSRVPLRYISYYAASPTNSAPDGYPTLGENNNSITSPTNPAWQKEEEYVGSQDENAFLFEIAFIEYEAYDEKGHNKFVKISGPVMIGKNGDKGPKGNDAVNYKLTAIPNSWNKTLSNSLRPSFVVTQHIGSSVITLTEGYTIKIGDTNWTNQSIDDTTIFDLYINDQLMDSQTISAVSNGIDGKTPQKGVDYFDGTNGNDGTSIVWKGEFDKAPTNPKNGWAYYNTTAKASYTYQDGSWYQMSVDGIDGQNGADGRPIVWKGELTSPPSDPQINWVYKDKDDGKVYIYSDAGWELMVLDGNDGEDGAPGTDGLSVFITYNDSTSKPDKPTGNGTTNNWHTEATAESVWMSQKIAASAAEGTWGELIQIVPTNYSLILTPNQWNTTDSPSVVPTIDIVKRIGSVQEIETIHPEPQSGWTSPFLYQDGRFGYNYSWVGFQDNYTYKDNYNNGDLVFREGDYYLLKAVGNTGIFSDEIAYTITANGEKWDGSPISVTTVFELWKGAIKLASETITAVSNGDSATILELTNDSAQIDTDVNGKLNLPYGDAVISIETAAQVYEGAKESNGWDYTISPDSGSGFTVNQNGKAFIIHFTNEFDNTDSQNFIITAAKDGQASLKKKFVVSKNKTGPTGAAAVVYEIVPSVNVINIDDASTSFSFYITKTEGNKIPEVVKTVNVPGVVEVAYLNEPTTFINKQFNSSTGQYTVNYSSGKDIAKQGIIISVQDYKSESIPFVRNGLNTYSIALSNDNATIGTDNNGGGYTTELLQAVSTTTVTVFEGNVDITDQCDFAWTAEGGITENTDLSSNYFTSLDAGVDTAYAIVEVNLSGRPIGSKQFTLSKIKQGDPGEEAITYVLTVTPNAWNLSTASSVKPTVNVIKYIGDQEIVQTIHSEPQGWVSPYPNASEKMYEYGWYNFQTAGTYKNTYAIGDLVVRNGEFYLIKTVGNAGIYSDDIIVPDYTIKVNGEVWSGSAFTDTTTVELWVNNKRVDSETISAVKNGDKGDPGENGDDAIAINLTNPTLTFSNTSSDESESCQVLVYEGTNKLSAGTGKSTFSIAKASNQAEIDGVIISGDTITIPDQNSEGSYTVTVTVTNKKGISTSQNLTIHWVVVASPYTMHLTNDSAIIVTDVDGNNDSYGENTKTTATVYCGSKEDTGWTYEVTPNSSVSLSYILSNNNQTIQVLGMYGDNKKLTITATKTGCPTQTKVFKISKLKQGEPGDPAVSYWLSSSINSIGITTSGAYKESTLIFTPRRQVGMQDPEFYPTTLSVYVDDTLLGNFNVNNGYEIDLNSRAPQTSVKCVMYHAESGNLLDEETILVVRDGTNGNTGTKTEAIRIYAWNSTNTAPPLGDDTEIDDTEFPDEKQWTTQPLFSDEEYLFVFTASGTRTTTYKGTTPNIVTYGADWLGPELWSAYVDNEAIDGRTYANFLNLMNQQEGGLAYDDEGRLYIKSEFIQSNHILVTDSSGKTVFAATSGDSGKITLSGWEVDNLNGFHNSDQTVGIVNPNFANSNLFRDLGNIPFLIYKPMVFYAGSFNPTAEGNTTKIPEFAVFSNGTMYATNAIIKGTIESSKGNIGKWNITSEGLSYGDHFGEEGYIGLFPEGYEHESTIAGLEYGKWTIAVGYNFGVTDYGKLYASGAVIQGQITATSGLIGAAADTGLLYVNSKIDVGGSSEGSSDGQSITYFKLDGAENPLNLDTMKWGVKKSNFYLGSGGLVMKTTTKLSRDSTHDGCRLTGSSLIMAGTGGVTAKTYGQLLATYNAGGFRITACGYNNLPSSNYVSMLNQSAPTGYADAEIKMYGIADTTDDYAYLQIDGNKSYLDIIIGGSMGGKCPMSAIRADVRVSSDHKLAFGSNTTSNYISSSSSGVTLNGTWIGTSGYSITSDRRLKYDICSFNTQHEILFDNLQARTFRYIDGASGRTHFGLIADELLQAIEIAGLSTLEAACYCGPVDADSYASIRYSEFIALNTWQIQKLKPRLTAVEEEIQRLKAEIQELRATVEAYKI